MDRTNLFAALALAHQTFPKVRTGQLVSNALYQMVQDGGEPHPSPVRMDNALFYSDDETLAKAIVAYCEKWSPNKIKVYVAGG